MSGGLINRFLSRGFTDRREIFHGGLARSRTSLLFWGYSPSDGRTLGVIKAPYGGICFLLKQLLYFYYQPRMRSGNTFSRVCLSVCLSFSGSNFCKLWPRNFIFAKEVPYIFRISMPTFYIFYSVNEGANYIPINGGCSLHPVKTERKINRCIFSMHFFHSLHFFFDELKIFLH